ncbi:hypothetical protein [Mycobacterium sp. 360MFTsu5.1]|uniref:hypothetical protein n=1 Tax=Mycobacterium sp. 360MFTsu5.1 TaxID=1172186 RepID=UPI00036A068B|nr:hypothetical protein [Mycobacterium sp. 360MFTsu5.1]
MHPADAPTTAEDNVHVEHDHDHHHDDNDNYDHYDERHQQPLCEPVGILGGERRRRGGRSWRCFGGQGDCG